MKTRWVIKRRGAWGAHQLFSTVRFQRCTSAFYSSALFLHCFALFFAQVQQVGENSSNLAGCRPQFDSDCSWVAAAQNYTEICIQLSRLQNVTLSLHRGAPGFPVILNIQKLCWTLFALMTTRGTLKSVSGSGAVGPQLHSVFQGPSIYHSTVQPWTGCFQSSASFHLSRQG